MRYIIKNQTIECSKFLQDFISDKKSRNEIPQYDNLPSKEIIRLSLLKEQGYLCAYCMQRISNDSLKTGIEHWKSRELSKSENNLIETLDYNNFLAVCSGDLYGEKHCDTSRGNSKGNPVLTIRPTDKRLVDQISYLKNGKIASANPNINRDLNSVQHLNLNLLLLRDNRKRALEDMQKVFKIRCKAKTFESNELIKKKIVLESLKKSKEGYFEPYSGILEFFYQKYLQ